ncbi:MAG: tryptophan 2,3-dioxygenase family protein [Chloroflexota bacterium]
MTSDKPFNYTSYLRVPDLLSLQTPASDPAEHDEMLFIIIHQVYELWFKQMLHEIDALCERLRANDTPGASATLRRLLKILKTVVAQVDVLETMTPLEFNAFRSFLSSASGFQSVQFRELEFALGHKRANMLKHFPEDAFHRDELERRYNMPTLWDAFAAYIAANGFDVPTEILERDVTDPVTPSETFQAVLVRVYREAPAAQRVCELLIDLDEGLQEWRYRHVKMVERTIGTKPGTGGSPGAKYLATTVHPAFPDLWAIRSML